MLKNSGQYFHVGFHVAAALTRDMTANEIARYELWRTGCASLIVAIGDGEERNMACLP